RKARRALRMHSVRMLQHLVPELLVEPGALSRARRAAAGDALDQGFTRRGDRRAARPPRGSVPPLPLPHHPELLKSLPEEPQPAQAHGRGQEDGGRAAGVGFARPSWPGLSRPSTSFKPRGRQDVDARDKRGHDESVVAWLVSPRYSRRAVDDALHVLA